jgi:hypothetical protein
MNLVTADAGTACGTIAKARRHRRNRADHGSGHTASPARQRATSLDDEPADTL